ncbi:MAG TPA: urate oxidase [Candidatus Acidoferrales bacterium]|nr:urate oxidase [Candidatus Acidoferrales bacterium]
MITLGENRYGKSRVRLVRVKRGREVHELRDWTVEILLKGDFQTCFTRGDNSKILPTDTMKNTVYSLARRSAAASMEEFATELIDFLLGRNPQVSHAEVTVAEKVWEHAEVGGKPHPTTFVQSSGERQTAKVERASGGDCSVVSGLENLIILKTAGSGFEGYLQDSLTTLEPTSDRLFATGLKAHWTYLAPHGDFAKLRARIREILIAVFAGHASKSVQHTMYAMGEAVLQAVAEVKDIALAMPNLHCLLVDLARFGQDNPNEIFVPTDEPHGYIEARMGRQG